WVPVYHSRYYPLDDGDPSVTGPIETYSPRSRAWQVPWQPTERTEQAWSFEQRGPHWRHEGDEAGVLTFEFADKHLLNYYNYNALRNGPAPLSDDPVEDMRVGATFVPEDAGLTVTMRTGSQRRQFRGTLDAEGNATLEMRPVVLEPQEDAAPWETVAQVEGKPLEVGQGTRVELWHADQRLSMWRDGDLLAEWTYEEEASTLAERSFEIIQPAVDITVAGPAVTLHKVNLDRDLYQTSAEKVGALGTSDPITIAADNFYCLGDNSPASEDSRLWDAVDPWLLHMTEVPVGFVPREMMIGRAFYVYFPAMWRFREGGAAVIPNFADMRFIR
ncbi:MAG: S26 family signal peptidase, partial [Phycisphaeraceae bacterium]